MLSSTTRGRVLSSTTQEGEGAQFYNQEREGAQFYNQEGEGAQFYNQPTNQPIDQPTNQSPYFEGFNLGGPIASVSQLLGLVLIGLQSQSAQAAGLCRR